MFKSVCCCLFLSGCALVSPSKAKLPLGHEEAKLPATFQPEKRASLPPGQKVVSELIPGQDAPVKAVDRSPKQPARMGQYSLNFDSADLPDVVKAIMTDMLGLPYVLNPKVSGKVVLHTGDSLTKEELLPTLDMILRLNGAALTKVGPIYHIDPLDEAVTVSALGSSVGVQLKVFPVKNVSVTEITTILKPLIRESTVLTVDAARNILVASGSDDELSRVADLLATFDIDVLKGRSFGLFPLSHVDPLAVIKELEAVFSQGAGQSQDKPESPFFRFLAIDRLNAVLAITHQSHYLKEIENWITRLDRVNAEMTGGYRVYPVQHVDAVKLASTLQDFFSKSKQNQPLNKETSNSPEIPSTNIRILADESNNSLLIASSAQEYEAIKPILAQLDVVPLQVLVDATIVSVNLTDNLRYGIQWYFNHDNAGIVTSGSQTSVPLNNNGADLRYVAASALTGGFGYSFISSSGDIRAILTAEAKANNINVISSPSLMVLNNQEASIHVGDEVPIRTSMSQTPIAGGTTTQPGATLTQTSQIQQRKTGVKLTVKPRVNASGLVTMDIKQSVERAVPSTSSNIDSPTIQSRTIDSTVAVQSGETIVLGGLIDENNDASKTGIPLLHDVPVIGSLFGADGINKARTELVVLITPRVVKNQQDAKTISAEFKRKLSGIYDAKL